jgi:hypothetical protein
LAAYLLIVVIAFPLIFTDGVDRLSLELKSDLKENNIPVAVSWRLDPQEVELYIDKQVYIVWETDFENGSKNVRPKIRKMISSAQKGENLFYFILADKEYSVYLKKFLFSIEKVVGEPVVFSTLDEDWFWRKRIKFRNLFYETAKNPSKIKDHLEEAFKEKVFLIVVRKK